MSSGMPVTMKLEVRADLFSQLAAMEEAGLPFDKALDILELPPNEGARLKETRKLIRRGRGIADAGLKGGLFTALEASLVSAATLSGSPARTYRLIADQCARRAARVKSVKSRMILPVVMIAGWIILGPVPYLVMGTLSPGGYVLKHLLPWIAVGVIAYRLIGLLLRPDGGAHSSWRIHLDRALPFVPLFGPMEVRRNLRDFFDSLALLLEGGVPIVEGFPGALETVRNQAVKAELAQIKPRIAGGGSFSQALSGLSLFGRRRSYELIRTGEASGTLPRMLFRYAEAETASIERFDDLVAEWVPRLVYAGAAVLIGYGLIQSGAFMPSLPQDLR